MLNDYYKLYMIKVTMKELFVLGIALFFCLFFVGCSWVTAPPIIPDNGGIKINRHIPFLK